MKAEIHPEYREVVFQDTSSDLVFKTRSTVQTKDTIKWEDGNEYPLVKVEVSSKSPPSTPASTRSWTPAAASTASSSATAKPRSKAETPAFPAAGGLPRQRFPL